MTELRSTTITQQNVILDSLQIDSA